MHNIAVAVSTPTSRPPANFFNHDMLLDIPLAILDQLSWFCLIPASCVPLTSSLERQCEKLKSPWLRVSTVQQQLKHWCVIFFILIINPKQNIILATRKKIKSTPVKTHTNHSKIDDIQMQYLIISVSVMC